MTSLYKVEAILAYITNYPGMKNLGKVKLMKLFYFIDFGHVREFGTPITYDTYINLEHGPIPSSIKNLVDNASDDPENAYLKDVIACETPKGTHMCKIVPRRNFTEDDEDFFSDSELKVLEEVCNKYKSTLTEEIENDSHEEAPWQETERLDKIPYHLAARHKSSRYSEDDVKLVEA
jgi:uncharacterized phage-associated protein